MKSRTKTSAAVTKAAYILSGGVCARPGCGKPLLVSSPKSGKPIPVAELGHFHPYSEKGPGGRPAGFAEVNGIDNQQPFCPSCHLLIDTMLAASEITPADVKDMVECHRDLVRRSIRELTALTSEKSLKTLDLLKTFNWADSSQYQFINQYQDELASFVWYHATQPRAFRLQGDHLKALFKSAINIGHFLRMAGRETDAQYVLNCARSLFGDVYGSAASGTEALRDMALLIHLQHGLSDGHEREVCFCEEKFGRTHERTINAMRCSGCVRMRSGQPGDLDAADERLTEAAGLLPIDTLTPRTVAYVHLQQGKLSIHRAENSKRSDRKRFARDAIAFFRQADAYFTPAEWVSATLIRYFLWKAHYLAGHDSDAEAFYAEARQRFEPFFLRSICHCDLDEVRRELGLAPLMRM